MSIDPSPIRILAVDDHLLIRVGIATLVGPEADMKLVGEASNGREAIAKVPGMPSGRDTDGPADAGNEWDRCDDRYSLRIPRSALHRTDDVHR